jgi:hypothetical protein
MRDNDWTGLYSTGDYENLLEIARYLHPEPFCIKHVPAAAVIESDLGLIYMFAVNGRPTSTPAHIEQYMPGNLARLIQQIPDDAPERIPLLTGVGMADPDNPLSCMDIRDLSGSPTCIKGFNYVIPAVPTVPILWYVDSGVQEVCFREMSKYVTEGNVIIDDQDIWSLQYMLDNGVMVVSNSTNTPVIRN